MSPGQAAENQTGDRPGGGVTKPGELAEQHRYPSCVVAGSGLAPSIGEDRAWLGSE
jgi:hypothetical protein